MRSQSWPCHPRAGSSRLSVARKGLRGHGRVMACLVPQGGGWHRALPVGANCCTRLHPWWNKTQVFHARRGRSPSAGANRLQPGTGSSRDVTWSRTVPHSTRCASCSPKGWPPPGAPLRPRGGSAPCQHHGSSGGSGASPVSGARNEAKPPQTNQPQLVTGKEAAGTGGNQGFTAQLHRGAGCDHGRVFLEGGLWRQQPPAWMASATLPWELGRCHGGLRHRSPSASLSQASFAACC